jgi:hypothetical protein
VVRREPKRELHLLKDRKGGLVVHLVPHSNPACATPALVEILCSGAVNGAEAVTYR